METMVISCPECGTKMKVPESTFGKKVRCKNCEQVFPVRPPQKAAVEKEKKEKAAPPQEAIQPAKSVKPPPKAGKPGKPDKPAPKPDAPAKPPTVDDLDDPQDDGKAYGVTNLEEGNRCPQCAGEMEGPDAIICLHCGFNTRTRTQSRMKKTKQATGQDKFLWRLPGILCVIAILSMIGYWCFHHFALPDMMIDKWDELLANAKDDRREALGAEDAPWYGLLFTPAFELWMAIIFAFISYGCGKFAVKRLILHPNPPEVELR